MAIRDLKTQMDKIVVRTEKRMLLVVQGACQELIMDAQTPVGKGGKMRSPVPGSTGFLRSSGVASVNVAPRGPSRGDRKGRYTWDGDAVFGVVARLKMGDVLYFGWTARYAKYREAYDGFLELALQKWQSFVDAEIAYYRKKDVK